MHHNRQPGMYTNSLSSHASLLLSATPTIISSPLQNNTNSPNSSLPPSSLARRQPSTPLLVASNLDNDGRLINTESPLNNPSSGYINFKKPQNEMFKKLDGKIQKIVAAHSNLNKLYALNDFPSYGVGPKRPFELPPQLPPPPPWVPKNELSYGSQWVESLTSPVGESLNEELSILRTSSSSSLSSKVGSMKNTVRNDSPKLPSTSKSSITLDSAISRLHQRRQQQLGSPSTSSKISAGPKPASSSSLSPSSSSTDQSIPSITPAQFSLLAQKIKETLEGECLNKTQTGNLTAEDKRKFREDLITVLKEEISAVTKSAKLNFSPPATTKSKEQNSPLMKISPQTLFNTIRRETSLLLNKRNQQAARSSLSLLSDQQSYNNRQNVNVQSRNIYRQQIINKPQTMKVIVPPIEAHSGLKLNSYLDREPPQPTAEVITVEQFAKCLDLVRSNDASLQKRQELLLQSEAKFKANFGTRPLRLRRLHGEKIRLPPSASYRATKKVGLQ